MSRGFGATQRFVLEVLHQRRHRPVVFAWHSVHGLAAARSGRPTPSAAAVESVRRAVRRLQECGVVDVEFAREQAHLAVRGNCLVTRLRIRPGEVERLVLSRLKDPYLHRLDDCAAGLDREMAEVALGSLMREGSIEMGWAYVGEDRVPAVRRLR